MAEAVADAMDDGRHLLVQAGTGTGKSLGYLVPSLLHDKRVVVATATLALQHQLVERDIPRLVEAVGDQRRRVSYAVLKGRSNYACLHRIREGVPDDQGTLVDVPDGLDGREGPRAARLGRGGGRGAAAAASATTPRATPTASGARSASATATASAPRSARSAQECFAELAREKAQRSHLIVTNHSLLAIDAIEGVPMIPDYDAVVIDEAHELVARVTQAATDELTVTDVERAARRSQRHVEGSEADDLADAADALADAIAAALARPLRHHARAARRRAGAGPRRRPRLPLGVPQGVRRRATPTPAAPRPGARCRRSSSTPSGWPPTPSPTCSGWPRAATGSRRGSASRRSRCGARCATSCSPTRPSCSPAPP